MGDVKRCSFCPAFMHRHIHKICYPCLGALVLILGLSAYTFHAKYVEIKGNPQKYAEVTAKQILEEVSKLMVLPTDEIPTVATVSDPDKLKGLQFFEQAKIGDKVLIYTNAKKAVLYDPQAKKVIEVAPLFLGVNETASKPSLVGSPGN